jgi:hypothetical protein
MSRDVAGFLVELNRYFEGLPPTERTGLDRGASTTVWEAGRSPRVEIRGAGDGETSDAEILQESFERLRRLRFGTSSFGDELCAAPARTAFPCWFRDHSLEIPSAWVTPTGTSPSPTETRFLPPWLIDDTDGDTTTDRDLRQLLDATIALARQAVLGSGLALESPEGRAALALELQERIHRPRADGGLGLRYDYVPDRSHWRPDAVQAFARGSGDCNALSYIHFAMAERAGLNPRFIRISGRRDPVSGDMEEIFHVGTAVVADPSRPANLTPMDPSGRYTIDADWEWFPVTELEMAAFHLRNVALRNAPAGAEESAVLAEQERLFGMAVALTPNFEVMLDAAWFYRERRHDEARADTFTASARALNPSLRAIW